MVRALAGDSTMTSERGIGPGRCPGSRSVLDLSVNSQSVDGIEPSYRPVRSAALKILLGGLRHGAEAGLGVSPRAVSMTAWVKVASDGPLFTTEATITRPALAFGPGQPATFCSRNRSQLPDHGPRSTGLVIRSGSESGHRTPGSQPSRCHATADETHGTARPPGRAPWHLPRSPSRLNPPPEG